MQTGTETPTRRRGAWRPAIVCRAERLRMSTWRLHGTLSGRGATPHGAFSALSEPEAREAHEEGAQGHHRRSNASRHDPGTSESGQEVPGIRMPRRCATSPRERRHPLILRAQSSLPCSWTTPSLARTPPHPRGESVGLWGASGHRQGRPGRVAIVTCRGEGFRARWSGPAGGGRAVPGDRPLRGHTLLGEASGLPATPLRLSGPTQD